MADGNGRLLSRFKVGDALIETGTFDGSGILSGLRAGFKNIVTIELDVERWRAAKDCFGPEFLTDNGLEGVTIETLWGKSENQLRHESVKALANSNPTFMLDAHWSGEGTAGEPGYDPWMHELEAIRDVMAGSSSTSFVIMIDDVDPTGPRGYDEVCKMVKGFFPNARTSFERGSHPQYYHYFGEGLTPWNIPGSEEAKIKKASEIGAMLAKISDEKKAAELECIKQGYLSLTTHTAPSILVAFVGQ